MATKSTPSGLTIGSTLPKCPYVVLTDGSEDNHNPVVDNEDGTFTCALNHTFEWTSQTDYTRIVEA